MAAPPVLTSPALVASDMRLPDCVILGPASADGDTYVRM
jgi:hypothetical protein